MKFATKAIHAGQEPDPSTGAIMTPIFQTSTFVQASPGKHQGYAYARGKNPTRNALEKCIASLENAKHALCFSSGMGAIDAVIKLLNPGDEVITGNDLYGGSYRMFTKVFERMQIKFHFIDLNDAQNIKNYINKNTKLIWVETPTNPTMQIVDIAACAKIAHENNLLLGVDNTFASPYIQQPLKFGIDCVVHSSTKFLNGHGTGTSGVLVGKMEEEWYQKVYGIQKMIGGICSPFEAFLLNNGIKTLPLRMEQHQKNALQLAQFLEQHPQVNKVNYLGLESHPDHTLAKEQMQGYTGMLSFEINGGLEAGMSFMRAIQFCTLTASLGTADTLVTHPASTSHSNVPKEQRLQFGITDGLIRMSVGMENIEDIIGDIQQALDKL